MNKKVSIIISSFNYERFVAKTIDSALNQTYQDVEVICVDDGSTDRSREIISSYGDRLKVVLKDNGGQGSAMNSGFEVSTGDLIIFVDSDDILTLQCAETVVAQWDEKYSKAHCKMRFIDEAGESSLVAAQHWSGRFYPTGNLRNEVLKNGGFMHPPTSANVFSRKYLEEVMPIPADSWPTQPDIYLTYLAAFYGEIGVINEELCLYRVHRSAGGLIGNGRLIPKRWKRELTYQIEIDREVRKRAGLLGLRVVAKPLQERYFFLKEYLVWRNIDVESKSSPADGLLDLGLGQIFKSIWRLVLISDAMSVPKKVAYLVWASLVFALPKRLAEFVVRISDPRCRIQSV